MTKADELRALADRCEREEGSIALDDAIARALYFEEVVLGIARIPYTTSLDAAVTLAPEGFYWEVSADRTAHVFWPQNDAGDVPSGISDVGATTTPAAALCAAALRARAAVSHPDPGAMRSERSERATSNPNLRTP